MTIKYFLSFFVFWSLRLSGAFFLQTAENGVACVFFFFIIIYLFIFNSAVLNLKFINFPLKLS